MNIVECRMSFLTPFSLFLSPIPRSLELAQQLHRKVDFILRHKKSCISQRIFFNKVASRFEPPKTSLN